MNPNITRIIEQYLQGELNAEDQQAFEAKLATNENLQAEVSLQKNIHQGAKRASQRADIKNVAKKYHYSKLLKWGGASLGAVILIVGGMLLLSPAKNSENSAKDTTVSEAVQAKIPTEKLIDDLATQLFTIPQEGAIVLSKEGILISAPKGAFMENGKIYNGDAIIKLQEALDATSIVKSGLSTMSGDRLLETQGMFSFEAFTPNGERLDINPEVGVYMQVPVDEYKANMQLFDGVKLADGSIDWQNPEPLAKLPVSAKMNELDFYPVGYEKHLDEIKWKKSKKRRDSLYLSFEEGIEEVIADTIKEIKTMLVSKNIAYTLFPDISAEFPGGTKQLTQFIQKNTIYPQDAIDKNIAGRVYLSMIVTNDGTITDVGIEKSVSTSIDLEAMRIVRSMPKWIPAISNGTPVASKVRLPMTFSLGVDGEEKSETTFKPIIEEDTTCVDEASEATQAKEVAKQAPSYILPSSVLAFWKSKFNNTNLATRDFEKRMRAIHSTCNNAVLRKYTKQLDKPISQIDKEVVAMGYSAFEQFALENVGAVNPNNPHIKALEEFYQKGIAALKDKAKRNAEKDQKRRNKWDKKVNKARTDETMSEISRESIAFIEEFQFNLKNVRKQISKAVGFKLRRGNRFVKNIDRYVPLQNPIKNINAYVWEATVNRTSLDMKDPLTGKRVKITYNDFSIEVPNSEKYIKLYAYLFPHQLNSYQRISGIAGKFDYPLNDDIIYDIGIVGVTEDGYEYFQKQTFNGGELGAVSMRKVTEKQLDGSIKQLNKKRIRKPMRIKDEMNWLFLERKDYLEQKQRKKMRIFRREVVAVIFPCYSPVEVINNTNESYVDVPPN